MESERIKRTLVEPLKGRAILPGIAHIPEYSLRLIHERGNGTFWTELVLPRNYVLWEYEEEPKKKEKKKEAQ